MKETKKQKKQNQYFSKQPNKAISLSIRYAGRIISRKKKK